jgi:hypothetical protein
LLLNNFRHAVDANLRFGEWPGNTGKSIIAVGFLSRARLPSPRLSKQLVTHAADYLPITACSGNLSGICSQCGTRMYRRASLRKMATAVGDLQVLLPQAQQRIVEGADPSVNCDLERVPDAQPGK